MNILLTGHLGYVGCVLAPMLLRAGHSVTGLDSGLYTDSYLYPPSIPLERWLERDIRDVRRADFDGIDVVIHLAGLSNDPLGRLNPDLTDEINHHAAANLAELARAAGVRRFVAASSCSIYGAAGDAWIDEDATPAPVSEYARSKLAMENAVMALTCPGFEVVVARPGTVFGESPALRFDLVLNNLVAWGVDTGRILFRSDGSAWRPLIHVHNLAEVFMFLATAPSKRVASRAFNIGFNEQNCRVRELAPVIQSVLSDARIETHASEKDPRSYRVDCSRLQRIWAPESARVSIEEGVSRLVYCLERHRVTAAQFEGPKYQRVACLERAMEQGWLDDQLRKTSARRRYA